jgi:antitoxin component of MazEF toxin-antitoxin module
MQPTTKQLRKLGNSLSVTIPVPYIRKFEFSVGDVVSFDADDTGLQLKFLKLSTMSDLAGATPTEPDGDCP